jgi:SOUL heme-binding protein
MALIETLKYKVIQDDGHIQIRAYDNILLASTKTKHNSHQDSGFNQVFQYISGNNESKTKISMTTPVVTFEDEGDLITGFYVPSKYDKNTVPQPSAHNVFINEIESSMFAVIRFKGAWNEKNYEKHNIKLLDYIKKNKLNILSKRYIFRYSPPFVPALFRKNEIAYQITRD